MNVAGVTLELKSITGRVHKNNKIEMNIGDVTYEIKSYKGKWLLLEYSHNKVILEIKSRICRHKVKVCDALLGKSHNQYQMVHNKIPHSYEQVAFKSQ